MLALLPAQERNKITISKSPIALDSFQASDIFKGDSAITRMNMEVDYINNNCPRSYDSIYYNKATYFNFVSYNDATSTSGKLHLSFHTLLHLIAP